MDINFFLSYTFSQHIMLNTLNFHWPWMNSPCFQSLAGSPSSASSWHYRQAHYPGTWWRMLPTEQQLSKHRLPGSSYAHSEGKCYPRNLGFFLKLQQITCRGWDESFQAPQRSNFCHSAADSQWYWSPAASYRVCIPEEDSWDQPGQIRVGVATTECERFFKYYTYKSWL